MSTGRDNLERIENLKRRAARLELNDKCKDDLIADLQTRVKLLEQPITHLLENTETRGLLTCPQCGAMEVWRTPDGEIVYRWKDKQGE